MNNQLLQKTSFQDLMLNRIHEILLVASPYDAFILEEEGGLTQQILYEYLGMNLSYAPRVWHAETATKGLKMLSDRAYDMVIVMMRIADMDPLTFSQEVKENYLNKPVILLAFDESEIQDIDKNDINRSIDKIFIWSGNADVFPAIIKYLEDKMNIQRDFNIADIRSILVVEDDPRQYSITLPFLYQTMLKYVRSLIDNKLSDIDKMFLFRARPKIILLSDYDDAINFYEKFSNNIIGIVSDVRFPVKGIINDKAGIKFVNHVRKKSKNIPIVLQSTDEENTLEALKNNAGFIHKSSPTLLKDMEDFMVENFGFGDFTFRDRKTKVIAKASTVNELKNHLKKIPDSSLKYHSDKNHFSNWLAVRGELRIASNLRPLKIKNFKLDNLRELLIDNLNIIIKKRKDGQIVEFDLKKDNELQDFTRLGTGSLGGKARGLAFAKNLISNIETGKKDKNTLIRIPRIAVIGTDDFDRFMKENDLNKIAFSKNKNDKDIISKFLKGEISSKLKNTLSKFLDKMRSPLAIRSSSLLEDSQYQPLSGMYATYMLPNSNRSKTKKLNELIKAIKLVYASTYLKEPSSLIEKSVHRHEEEKMAVIIMELIGKKHQSRFYLSASGLAQSYNYYPVSYMKRNEGVAYLALGLGRTIAEGDKSLRFSPKYPDIIPQYFSMRSTIENSQNQFYALDLKTGSDLVNKNVENTSPYELEIAEKDGELDWAASVITNSDGMLRHSLRHDGIRVITFPNILKWKKTAILDIINTLLHSGEKAMGCPVEIEFAINFHKDGTTEFCLLQIKPMLITGLDVNKRLELSNHKKIICKSSLVLGNGIIEDLENIIFIDPESFDASRTKDIALEISKINEQIKDDESFVLIGPGRWGSADPWLGIPVEWDQISKTKIIIEYGMHEFPVDPSFGSHFFQNVTSMRIGYFTLNHKNQHDILDIDWIRDQQIKERTDFLIWSRLSKPIQAIIDGQEGKGILTEESNKTLEMMDEHEASGI